MNLERYLTYPHRGIALQAALGALLSRTSGRALRKNLPPSLEELAALTRGFRTDVEQLIAETPWLAAAFGDASLADLRREHDALQDELRQRYETRDLPLPAIWAVEAGTSLLLYALVRGLRPQAVVEIGVGNGQSSFLILKALEANGSGTLYSFDVLSEAGGLLADAERAVWEFRLVDTKRSTDSLVAHLAKLPKVDLCFHDADHGYLAQYFELQRLWEQLADGGTLVVDDVDASYGLIDFCRLVGRQPEILVDSRKAIGLMSPSSPPLRAAA